MTARAGKARRRAWLGLDAHGRALPGLKGECEVRGSVLITSGRWRLSKHEKFVKCLPSEPGEAEFDFGNP